MLLGGFLKQMNDTIRYNLNLREKLKRKPTKSFRKAQKKFLPDSKTLNETERRQLLLLLKAEQENATRKKRIAFIISVLLTLLLFSFAWWIFF